MMNRLLFIIFISYIFTNTHSQRCGFYDNIISPSTRIRPTLDTSIFSPSGHFQIHFDTTGNDAPLLDDTNKNNIPDYVEEVGIIADSSRTVLINIMGFYSEVDDDDGIYDIYIEDRGTGSYGFTSFDDQFQLGATYMLIDDEYEASDYYIPGINTMRLTVAHEFFHAIQRAYRPYPSGNTTFLYEMSSTWIEDVIVPDGDDYIYWVDDFFNDSDKDIDDTDGYSIALFGHYLTQVIEQEENQMSSSIIREIWEYFENVNNGHSSIDNVLTTYNSSFTESWTNFCARNLFNGKYTDMNNSVYYYVDQINTDPIQTNPVLLNQNQDVNDIIINEKSIAPLLSYNSSDFFTMTHNSSIINNNYYGLLVIERYDEINIDIFEINNENQYNLNQNDIIHFLYSSYDNSELLDIDINLEPCDINNPPFGYCDCSGNILDDCGVCDGGNADQDCAGVCFGESTLDDCGVCDGGNADNLGCGCFEDDPSGCDDICGSTLEFDECGECGGNNSCFPSGVSITNIYPNPFNPLLNIKYELPDQRHVVLSIYDIMGNLIDTIIDDTQNGKEEAYSISWNAENLSSGIYYVNLLTDGNKSITKTVTLLK